MYKHRFLIVKRFEKLTRQESANLGKMFEYLPELRPLWYFCCEVYQLFSTEQVIRLARRRRKHHYIEFFFATTTRSRAPY